MKCLTILARLGEIQSHIKYEHIYGNVYEQRVIAWLFIEIVKVKEKLIKEQEDKDQDQEDHYDSQDDIIGLPRAINNSGPST